MAINNTVENINNQPTIQPRTVTGIFTKYIAKTLPLAFDESMSYYECLCALLDYINKNVIPALDNNAEGLEELQEFYEELQTYVNDYFKNLDVQEEINNKLDDMADSGELTDIIAQYLGLAGMITFNNVSEMKLAENLVNGSKCCTLGYYSVNDGGKAFYKIRQVTNEDVVDEMLIIALDDENLVAELIIENEIIPLQLGAKGDGTTDDTSRLQLAVTNFNIINGLNKTYLISDVLSLKDNIEIKNCKFKGNNSLTGITGDKLKNVYIHDCIFSSFNKAIELSCYWSTFDNITFYECGECFYMINGSADGNLVENKYMNCDAQNVGRFLFVQSGNKLTDGFIKNININSNDDTKEAINIQSGAGYYISGIHTYGTPLHGIKIDNIYNTNINNIYIENYKINALNLYGQQSCNLNNIIINALSNKNLIVLEKSGAYYATDVMFNINNLMINGSNAINPTNVFYSGTSPKTQVNNLSANSSYTLNGFYTNSALLINEYFINKVENQLFVENNQLQLEKIQYMAGKEKTLTIPILIRSYTQRYFHVAFLYTSWLGGTTLNKIETDVLISRPNDNEVVITKNNSSMPITISYDKDNQTASFTYTPADNSQYGNLVINY